MVAYSLLVVYNPRAANQKFYKCYADGRRVTAARFNEIATVARMFGSHDCFTTRIHKDGRIFHRSEARTA